MDKPNDKIRIKNKLHLFRGVIKFNVSVRKRIHLSVAYVKLYNCLIDIK